MRRLYACFAIVLTVCILAWYSSYRVQNFAQEISLALDQAIEALRDEDTTAVRQALEQGASLCDKMRREMTPFLRIDDFTELETSLRAADGYLEQDAPEEAMGELRRAEVQVENLDRLSRRLL